MPKRSRRTFAEVFTDKLTDMSESGKKMISNKAMKEALGWDEAKYVRIRAELISRRQIVLGRGYGGSVGLVAAPGSSALKVFISYSHADEMLKAELIKHLEPLRKLGIIETWHDRMLKAGEDWNKQISGNLEVADLIILMVSIDFINSAYCYDVELEKALERHSSGEALVIPVIARSCMWKTTPFASIQAVPKDGRPIALFQDRDDALTSVAESIREAAEALLARR